MDRKIKELWVDTLRNGNYSQGRGQLRDGNKNLYCCLGVLCDLHAKEHGVFWLEIYQEAKFILPNGVMEWAKLKDRVPRIHSMFVSLSDANDYGLSFDVIADYIERDL